ncbi:RHS repeat-associated protein [Micromonospora echinospora]|uniref:RHS repeat-associated protein n=1 Tax=Micromonospora echinospora TaxID=1877 RepID=A0ABR6M9U9_MICEC|nr:LamG-like jellyroll fold domain-containing protein [Micromonospora echinospora]MBB5112143.1 RHS repeat-associated protein [Micromonospora echinospora]
MRSGVRRVATVLILALALLTAAPREPLPPAAGNGWPTSWLTDMLSLRPSWGAEPPTPKQKAGRAPGGHYVAAARDRARPSGERAKGELPRFQPHRPAGQVRQTGPGRQGYQPRTSKRLPAASTTTSDVFQNADGSVTRRVYQRPVNWRDADGTWRSIDPAIVRRPDGRFSVKAHPLGVTFAASGEPGQPLVDLTLDDDRSLGFDLAGAVAPTARVNGNELTYERALPDVDVTMAVTGTDVKETLVLHSAKAPTEYVYPLRLRGLTAGIDDDGDAVFLRADGTEAARMPVGYLEDASVDASGTGAISHSVRYTLVPHGTGQALKVTIDGAWLRDPKRKFPVLLDPSTGTIKTATGDTYVQSDVTETQRSGEDNVAAGTFDGTATGKARALLPFSTFGSTYAGKRLSAADLNIFMSYQGVGTGCVARRFDVYRVTQNWAASTVKFGTFPTLSASIGNASPSNTAACGNTAKTRNVGTWVSVPLNATEVNEWVTGAGTYGLAIKASETDSTAWKRFTSANSPLNCAHSTYGTISCTPFIDVTYTDNVAPQIDVRYPADNYTVSTLTPELAASGRDSDAWPNKGLRYTFVVKDSAGTQVAASGWVTSGVWKVPAGALSWGKTYTYTVQVSDWSSTAPATPVAYAFTTAVPQPMISADLGQNGGKGFEPSTGNYTTSDSDAEVATAGPALSITRDYNSRDVRADSAFGQGWSSLLDMQVREQPDASGAVQTVAVRYPSGEEVAFGRNANGVFVPPSGRFSVFKPITGGYSLTDKDATAYEFTRSVGGGVYRLTRIADSSGRAETLRYDANGLVDLLTSVSSGRTLAVSWSTPADAGYPHVTQVTSDPVTAGDTASRLTWRYSYDKDLLRTVCPPGTTTDCTRYDYTTSSQYEATTLNAGPYSYWRLNEPAGATSAMSTVLSNDGADNAAYTNVTLGSPGPLAGSSATAAGFNGTTSSVQLRQKAINEASYQSVSLWFKTSTAGGVLLGYSDDLVTPGATTTKAYVPALYIGTDGKLRGEYLVSPASAMASAAVVTDDRWHHVVLAGNGGSQTLYLDGSVAGTLTGAINMAFSGVPNVYVGAGFLGGAWPAQPNTTGTASFFNGSVAEVAMFNTAVTASTVTAMWNSGRTAAPSLSKITSEAGRVQAQVTYDPVSGRVSQVTDENGGTWKIGVPQGISSSQGYVSAVLGTRARDYFRLGDIDAPAQAVNEVVGGSMQYHNVTFDTSQPNTTSPFPDRFGARFNGTSSYLSGTGNTAVGTTDYPASVEMWFRIPAGTTKSGVLYSIGSTPSGEYNVPALYVGSDGVLRGGLEQYRTGITMTSGSTKVNDGKWHHVVLGKHWPYAQALYLDNKLVASKTETAQGVGGPAYIGVGNTSGLAGSSGATSYFTGEIAEFAFYDKLLTAAQVNAHYEASKAVGSPTADTTGPTLTPVSKVTVTDPGNKVSTRYFDLVNGNRLIAETDVLGNTTSYGYDVGGFASVEYDPLGQLTESGKDVRGNTIRSTTCARPHNDELSECDTTYYSFWPDATTTQLTPDARNDQITDIRDPRSRNDKDERYRTKFTYDTAGNRTSMVSPPVADFPAGRTVSMTYTTATTPAVGGGVTPPGLPLTTTSAAGSVQRTDYNAAGDVVKITDAAGLVTEFAYDGLGRAISRKVISDAYPAGLVTTFRYDADGQVTESTEPAVTNRVTGAVHTLRTVDTFDADGNVLTRTQQDLTGGDASRTVTNSYDERGRLVKVVDPVGVVTLQEYDAYGNQTTETTCDSNPAPSSPCPSGDVLRRLRTTYDGEGQVLTATLTGKDGTTTQILSRAYYANGDLASETDAMNWTTKYDYYSDGKLKKVSRTDGTTTQVLEENTYDEAGNLAVKKENNGATTTSYLYDPASRVISSRVSPDGVDRISTYAYDGDDRVTATRTMSGAKRTVLSTTRTGYDPMGRPTSSSVGRSADSGPAGWWKLDETSYEDNAGFLALRPFISYDSSPSHNDMEFRASDVTTSGGVATFTTAGYMRTPNKVLDTTASYSVSAWVRAGNLTATQTALGQGGTKNAAFSLQYNSSLAKWAFSAPATDVASPSTTYSATSATAVAANTWVHMVAVFDAATKRMSLYVNNVAGTSVTNPTPFASATGMTIGGNSWSTGGSTFVGSVDNVQAYQRALSTAEVSTLYNGGNGRTAAALWTNEMTTVNTVDKRGLTTAVKDPLNNVTNYDYDEADQAVQTVAPAVTTESYGAETVNSRPVSRIGYNTFGEQVEVQDPLGNVTQSRVDALGRPHQMILPDYTPPGGGAPIVGARTVTTYDKLGQVIASTDPLDKTTAFEYDMFGNVTKVTGPTGRSATALYDKVGDLLESVDATGAKTTATYDMLGRTLTSSEVVRQPTPATNTSVNDYGTGAYGTGPWLQKTTTPEGVVTSYGYNSAGETISVKDGANNVTLLEYDGLGQVVKTTNPDSTKQVVTYDGAGRQTRVQQLDPANAVLTTQSAGYDDNGNLTSATDARTTTTTFTYDAMGRMTGETQPTTPTTSIQTSFGYDAAGNRTRFTNGRALAFWTTYNSWGKPESQIEPATPAFPDAADRTFSLVYDAAGRVTDQLAPGGVRVHNDYDDLGRLTGQTGSGAEAATASRSFDYDDAGRITSLSVPAGTNTITYDDRGLPLSITGPQDNVSYAYNRDGNVTSRSDAAGATTFGYDGAGRLRTAANTTTGVNLTVGYNVMSQIATMTYGSGNVRTLGYDYLQRLKTDTLKNAAGTTTLASITYGYDNNGNETSKVTTGFAGSGSNTYTYDLADRLTSWNNGSTTIGYAYDGAGNRTQAGSRTFTYDARNQLATASDGVTYAYTARGTLRQTSSGGGVLTTVADAYGQVLSQQSPTGTSTYSYDALGRAIQPGFRYSGLGNDLAQDSGTTYTRGTNGELLATGAGNGANSVYTWTDQHDDVVGQFTATGTALSGSRTYDPLGNVVAGAGLLGNLGYQSEWTDSATGRVNMLARWYNPATGQFDTRDTAANDPMPDSIAANRFQYGDGNPLTTTDPTGHWGLPSWKSVVNVVTRPVAAAQQVVNYTYKAAVNTYRATVNTYHYVASGKAWKDVKKGAKKVQKKIKKAGRVAWDSTKRWAKKKVQKVADAYNATKNCLKKGTSKCVREAAKKTVKRAVASVKSTVAAIKKDPWKFVATAAVAIAATVAVGALCATGVGCLILAGAVAGAMSSGAGYMVDVSRGDEEFSWSGLAGTMIEGGLDGALSAGISKFTGGASKMLAGGASRAPGLGGKLPSLGRGNDLHGAGGPNPAARPRSGANSSSSRSGEGCPTPHSFDPSTRVLMADGSSKAIKDVALGDKVAATDPEVGRTAAKPVTALHQNRDRDLTDVTVKDGTGKTTVLKTTQHHPFWDATDSAWVDAAKLAVGHRLLVHDDKRLEGDGTGAGMGGGGPGREVTVVAVDNFAGDEEMRDLTVADIHTYYVFADETPVLVHNCNRDFYDHGGSVKYGKLDGLNRPTGVHASINKGMLDTGQPPKGLSITGFPKGKGTLLNLGRGHLLADRLGGKRNKHNLVPLTQDPVNSPIMRDGIEQAIYDAVNGGQTVQYNVVPKYDGDSLIPRALEISAYGSGGLRIDPFEIKNPAGMFGVGDEDW